MNYNDMLVRLNASSKVFAAMEIGGKVSILAIEPVPHPTIDRITKGALDVETAPLTLHTKEDYPRFVRDFEHHEWLDRKAAVRSPGEAKLIMARAQLDHLPVVNVAIGSEVGILFGSVADAAKFRAYKGS